MNSSSQNYFRNRSRICSQGETHYGDTVSGITKAKDGQRLEPAEDFYGRMMAEIDHAQVRDMEDSEDGE